MNSGRHNGQRLIPELPPNWDRLRRIQRRNNLLLVLISFIDLIVSLIAVNGIVHAARTNPHNGLLWAALLFGALMSFSAAVAIFRRGGLFITLLLILSALSFIGCLVAYLH